jgi:hypothetical protein
MKEERMKILELLQAGKISADDAVKLLEALGDGNVAEDEDEDDTSEPSEPGRRSRRRSRRGRQRRHERHIHVEMDDLGDNMSEIQDEIQERIREARETLRASMPRVRRAVKDAMPEVDRIVREATRSIPDVGKIIREAMHSASDAFSEWDVSDADYSDKEVKKIIESVEVQPGIRLAVRTPRGHIHSEVWEKNEVQVEATITVEGNDDAVIKEYVEKIEISIERDAGVLRVQPIMPEDVKGNRMRAVRIDFAIHHPGKIDLDARTAHGNQTLSGIEGAASLHSSHGNIHFEGATGNVWVHQRHGNVEIENAGGDLSLDSQHGNVTCDAVGGSANLQLQHGSVDCRNIGGHAEIAQLMFGMGRFLCGLLVAI